MAKRDSKMTREERALRNAAKIVGLYHWFHEAHAASLQRRVRVMPSPSPLRSGRRPTADKEVRPDDRDLIEKYASVFLLADLFARFIRVSGSQRRTHMPASVVDPDRAEAEKLLTLLVPASWGAATPREVEDHLRLLCHRVRRMTVRWGDAAMEIHDLLLTAGRISKKQAEDILIKHYFIRPTP